MERRPCPHVPLLARGATAPFPFSYVIPVIDLTGSCLPCHPLWEALSPLSPALADFQSTTLKAELISLLNKVKVLG